MPLYLERHQLRRRIAPMLLFEAFDEDTRTGRRELLGICAVDQLLQTFAAREHRPHFKLFSVHLDDTARILAKSAPPAARLQAVRAHEHATLHDHGPDADDAVWFSAGPNAQNSRITTEAAILLGNFFAEVIAETRVIEN